MLLKNRILSTAALASALLLAGCGGNTAANVNFPASRVFNAVDQQPVVSVTFRDVNGNTLGTSATVPFGYTNPVGSDTVFVYSQAVCTINLANGTPTLGGTGTYTINNKYTIVAAGGTLPGATIGKYTTFQLFDNQGSTAATSFGLRIANAAILATNNVDVYVLPTGTTAPGIGAVPTFSNIAFGTASSSIGSAGADANGYVTLPTNGGTTFNVVFTLTGSQTPLFPAQAITIAGGGYYTDMLYDSGTGSTLAAALQNDKH